MTPRQIVEGVRSGSTEAETALYGLCSRWRFRSCGLQPADIQEFGHDLFVKVLISIRLNVIRDPDRLLGFVSITARNRVAQHFRTSCRCEPIAHRDWIDSASPSPEAEAERTRRTAWLRASLILLDPREQEALIRYYLLEQGQAELCHATQVNPKTFRSRKRRGLAKLRAMAA